MRHAPHKAPRSAVALEYDHVGAPRVTAKGKGEVAERIIATAKAHDIAIEENAILAEALSEVELEEQIPENLYRAVAQVLSFVLQLRKTVANR
ncbi:MAG: EscU/YscU/HrcU family type III secretion system export apparatus switch protein [Beijerinckiaceae bacterium]|nr:EscU/YscU/HrcU family type III secretion system export apparatus switch protein [Beijerinckiaceae bacterium]